MPRRLLSGTLPESLLEQYTFWHNPDDSLTGYPQASSVRARARGRARVRIRVRVRVNILTGYPQA